MSAAERIPDLTDRGAIVVACDSLSFSYEGAGPSVTALRSVGFSLTPRAGTALLGPTGSGKSTLLQVLRGLLRPDAGELRLGGIEQGSPGYEGLQRRLGLVFQMPEMQLFAATAREDVAFGPRQLGWSAERVEAAVEEALDAVGLSPSEYGERHPYSLSGGEQRRLAIAGVLAMKPAVLLLDEPFVSLDPGARRELAAILGSLLAAGMGLLLATHDVDQAWSLCDERLVLDAGTLVADGPWRFGDGDEQLLVDHGLAVPFLVELWRRLGRAPGEAPRTYAQAAEMLA